MKNRANLISLVIRGLLVVLFWTVTVPVFAQDDCCGHTVDWHQHVSDGYIFSYWKREYYRESVLWNEEEQLITDDWLDLLSGSFSNASCTTDEIAITNTKTFEHSVSTTWGGEISGAAEGLVRLWFWKAKATVGARVDWHRTGTSINTETFEIRRVKGLAECRSIDFFYDLREVHKKWVADFARAEFQCRDHHTGDLTEVLVCGHRRVSIEGRGYTRMRSGWENELKICECTDDGTVINIVDFE